MFCDPSVGVIHFLCIFEWYLVLSLFIFVIVVLICISLMATDTNLFMCLFAICISSLKCLLMGLCPDSNWIVWFLLLSFKSSL